MVHSGAVEGKALELSDHLAVRRFTYLRRRSVRNPGLRRARVSVLMGMLVVATLVVAGSPGASRRTAEAAREEQLRGKSR